MPTLEELKQYRIIVTTLYTARVLSLLGLQKGHFTHIFIDEAAQVLLYYKFELAMFQALLLTSG